MCVMSVKFDTKSVHVFSHECMCSELWVELVNARQFVIRVNDLCMGGGGGTLAPLQLDGVNEVLKVCCM
jgi:hypothetical protein